MNRTVAKEPVVKGSLVERSANEKTAVEGTVNEKLKVD